ncbi:MAG: AsnC family transcriptional regulator [Thaumarchaeota archaeon]|nr:AsnC family transcriptional regulator [Nitrososphaerota archaeon]
MDSLDVRIIREMLESKATSPVDSNVRKSLSSIARKLKVDENTVKNRIEGLKRSGFLRGWWVGVNPNLVSQKMTQVWFDVNSASAKQDVIKKVSLIPGVAVIKNLFGNSLCIAFYYEGERTLRQTTELISSIAGSSSATTASEPFPTCRITLSSDDLKIVKSLQKEPLKPYTEIARELGLSVKTIKRRIIRLTEGDALYIVAELDPKFLSGGIVCGLLIFYDDPRPDDLVEDIISYLGDKLMFANLDDLHHGYFAFIITNLAMAQQVLDWALDRTGVSSGRIDIVQEVISLYSVYEEQLEKLQHRSLNSAC